MAAGIKGTRDTLHGTRARYNQGCRCDLCLKANRDYVKAYEARKREKAKAEGTYRPPGGRAPGSRNKATVEKIKATHANVTVEDIALEKA